MADFRNVAATALRWASPPRTARGGSKYRTAPATLQDGTKLTFQTPTCSAKVYKNPSSTSLVLTLNDDAFAAWILEIEDAARVASVDDDWCVPASMSSCLRAGTLRLAVWDDVQWFGVAGEYAKEAPPPSSVHAAAALIELGGAWVSDASWGLKLRVVQIRQATCANVSKKRCFIDDGDDCDDRDDRAAADDAARAEKCVKYSFVD